jgi:hypothetical protein
MEVNKRIDLGEYIVVINYDDKTGTIVVDVLDELEESIESITVSNS